MFIYVLCLCIRNNVVLLYKLLIFWECFEYHFNIDFLDKAYQFSMKLFISLIVTILIQKTSNFAFLIVNLQQTVLKFLGSVILTALN